MLTFEEKKSIKQFVQPMAGDLLGKDVLSVEQFSQEDLNRLFDVADRMKRIKETNGSTDILRGKILANLFYEASTRTDSSFSIAMKRLGGEVHNIVGVQFSSVSKGETLVDTVRVLSGYADVIVLRHPEKGSALLAAQAIRTQRDKLSLPPVPLINAGDGIGEHPTQALLDVYTVTQKLGRLDNLTIGLVGDLKHGRTVHSLAKLMSLYEGTKLIFISPPTLKMPEDLVQDLIEAGVTVTEGDEIRSVADHVDVLYVTRVQKERFDSEEAYKAVSSSYSVTPETVAAMRPEAIIMHPLPRVGEISEEVDMYAQAVYFEQTTNGMYVRMALLAGVLGRW